LHPAHRRRWVLPRPAGAQTRQKMNPHPRQWCRRTRIENLARHREQHSAAESGCHHSSGTASGLAVARGATGWLVGIFACVWMGPPMPWGHRRIYSTSAVVKTDFPRKKKKEKK
jgi:hypothetical protein